MESNIYFSQLEGHLSNLPAEKRNEIIQDYRNYAAEHTLSGEALIKALGTPRQLAQKAMIEYSIDVDTIDENAVPNRGESIFKYRIRRIQRQFSLLGLIIGSMASNIAWYPTMFLIFLALFVLIVIVVLADILLMIMLLLGIYQIVAGIAILGHHAAVGVFQGGIGVILIGIQFIAWPIMSVMMRGLMGWLMQYTKSVGLRYAQITEVQNG
ncbi:DUF1700 domain-containing protein [Weissella kandleri]|uniref:DUF1700 domain-containing protein n=1 Tax=Weissella kandleri TaxID=1616 RepID=UPI00387EAAFB